MGEALFYSAIWGPDGDHAWSELDKVSPCYWWPIYWAEHNQQASGTLREAWYVTRPWLRCT